MFSRLRKTLSILLITALLAGLTGGFPLAVQAEDAPAPASSEVDGEDAAPPEEEGPGDETPGEEPGDETPQAPGPPQEPDAPEEPEIPEVPGDEPDAPEDESAEAPVTDSANADELPEAGVFSAEEAISEDIDSTLATLYAEPDDADVRAEGLPLGNAFTITPSELWAYGKPASVSYGGSSIKTLLFNHKSEYLDGVHGNDTNQRASLHAYYDGTDGSYLWPITLHDGDYTTAHEGDFDGSGRDSDFALMVYSGDPGTSTARMAAHTINIFEGSADPDRPSGEPYAFYGGNAVMRLVGRLELPGNAPDTKYMINEGDNALEMHLRTGDVDGDGRDEIIVLVPNYNDPSGDTSRLIVYKAAGGMSQSGGENTYREWSVFYDKAVGIGFGRYSTTVAGLAQPPEDSEEPVEAEIGQSMRRTHSLAVGDIDGDGFEDIALTSNEFIFHDYNEAGAEVDQLKDQVRAELHLVYGAGSAAGFATQTHAYNSADPGAGTLYGDTEQGALMELPTLETVGADDANSTSLGDVFEAGFSSLDDTPSYEFYWTTYGKDYAVHPTDLGVEIVEADGMAGNELLLGHLLTGAYSVRPRLRNSRNLLDIYGPWARSVGSLGYRASVLKIEESRASRQYRDLEYLLYIDGAKLDPLSAILAIDDHSPAYIYDYASGNYSVNDKADVLARSVSHPASYCYHYEDMLDAATGAVRLTAARLEGPSIDPELVVGGTNLHKWDSATQAYAPHLSSGSGTENSVTNPLYPIYNPDNKGYKHIIYSLRPAVMSKKGDTGELEFLYGFTTHFMHQRYDTSYSVVDVQFCYGGEGLIMGTSSYWYVGQRLHAVYSTAVTQPTYYCLPDTDYDKVSAEYVDYSLVYTDPIVMAAIAAAPYHHDAAEINEGVIGTTSYGRSAGSGTGEIAGSSSSSGQYFSTEVSIGAEVDLGVVEFSLMAVGEYGFEHTVAKNTETTHTFETEHSITFSTTGDDAIVVYSYPVDVYQYELIFPTDAEGVKYTTSPYYVNIPYNPCEVILTLEQYNALYKLYPDILPDLDSEVFTHEVGYPETYPRTSAEGYGFKSGSTGYFTANSGNFATGIGLDITSSEEASTTTETGWDHQAGAGLSASLKYKSFKVENQTTAGKVWGHSNTTGNTVSSTQGASYSGDVPYASEPHLTNFQWKLAQYNYRGKQSFPVVTYLVDPVGTNYLRLPEEYGVYEEETSHNAVALRWRPSRDDANPGPNSNVTYLIYEKIAGVEAPSLRNDLNYDYNPVSGYYIMRDEGRSAGTHYGYYLSVTSAKALDSTVQSVYTPEIRATTAPVAGISGITGQPEDLVTNAGNGSGKLTVAFDKGGFSGEVTYEWQRYKDGEWWSIPTSNAYFTGANTATLGFPHPAAGLAGTYRALVTLRWQGASETQGKQYVSESAEVTFSRAGVKMEYVSAEAVASPAAVDFEAGTRYASYTVKVSETATGSTATLNGAVYFALTSPMGGVYYQSAPVDPATGEATTTYRLYSEGAYSLKATYLGDSTHAAGASITSTEVKGATGTDTETSTLTTDFAGGDFVYGDTATINVTRHNNNTGASGAVGLSGLAVTLEKYPGSAAAAGEEPNPMTWLEATETGFTITFLAAGKYRLTIGLGSPANTITRTIVVKPRPVTYKVQDVLRYQDRQEEQPVSTEDLRIGLAPGSLPLAAGDPAHYAGGDLAVYNAAGSTVALDAATAAGSYTIRPKTTAANTNYDIKVQNGTYTVMGGGAAAYYDVEFYSGNSDMGTLRVAQPLGLQSQERVPENSQVVFEAVPYAGYRVTGWTFYMTVNGQLETVTTETNGHFYTTPVVTGNCTVVALFESTAGPVTSVQVSPTGAAVIPGGRQQFTADVTGGQNRSVTWGVEGATSAGTTIGHNTGLLMVGGDETTASLTVRATSVETPTVSGTATVTVKASDVVSVTMGRINASVPRGTNRQFTASVEVKNNAGTGVVWSVSGHASLGTAISRSGLLTVAADEAVGARLVVRAAAEADEAAYDEQVLLVTDDSLDGEFALAQSHVIMEAGGSSVSVEILAGTGLQAQGAQVYPMHTDRSAPSEDHSITAVAFYQSIKVPTYGTVTIHALNISPGTAEAGSSFTVRVTAKNRPEVWTECRVDVVAPAPGTPAEMEPRATAKTVEVNAYSTADILIPVARVADPDKTPWSLMPSSVQVSLADTNHADVLAAFKTELAKVDEGHLRLVPQSETAMESLKSSYKNVTLKLAYNGDDGEAAQAALASGFTLKVSKKLPTVKAQAVTLDTWAGPATGTPLFTGATVKALDGEFSKGVGKWLQRSGTQFRAAQGAKGSATVKLTAILEGWIRPVTVKVPVKATNTAPGLKLKSATAKLYKDHTLSAGIPMQLLPKAKANTLKSLGVDSLEVAPEYADGYTVTGFSPSDGTFTLKALKDPARETIRLRVYFTGARASTMLELPVKVQPVTSAIKLKPAATKIALNTLLDESYSLLLATNIADLKLSSFYVRCEVSGTDNAKLEAPVVLPGNRAVRFSTGAGTEASKTTKYTLKLWAKNPGSDTGIKPLHSVTVQVSTKAGAAAVSLAAKGKLDISKADPAPVTLTAKFKNYLGAYSAGQANVKFAVYYKNGKNWELKYDESIPGSGDALFEIRRTTTGGMAWQLLPADGVTLVLGSYRIGITAGGVAGGDILSPVKSAANPAGSYTTFTVTASKPKVTAAQAATLYGSDPDSECVVRLRLPDGYQNIRKVELKNGNKANMCYAVEYLGNGKVAVYFNPAYTDTRSRTAEQAAKNATLTLNLWLEGNGGTTRLTTAKVKVAVG